MLTIHFANRYERLAGLLVERLAARPRSSFFVPDQVIVPSAALRRQLTLAIARRDGICANVRFDYLAQWLWSLIARVVPGVQTESPFAPGVLAWRIFAAFSEPDAAAWIGPHPRLRDYLARADGVMRYDLAAEVAELFDQYITFRPDWLAAWAEARTLPIAAGDAAAAADQAWQSALWRRLGAEPGAEHPATAFARVLATRGAALVADGSLPDEVHVFCLASLAPLHLGLLRTLAGCTEVQVYALNPCREYWLEVVDRRRLAYLATRAVPGRELHHEVGNHLLAAWGAQTKAQLGALIDAAGDAVVDEARFDEPEGASLLARLQRSILDMEELVPGSVALAADDRSIEVHVCHSLARELEVLHDRLLALFAAPDAPQLSDILVVTPDLDAAAPLIDAIFGTAAADRRIAYQITGRARSGVNVSARILLDVLALVGSRLPASGVFGLLQQASVARRFALESDDLDRIHRWLQDAGVHWALDADHRASFGVPAQARHSFADGLARLYLGYALPARADEPLAGLLPEGDVEGTDGVALGALWQFVDALAALRRELGAPLPAAAWPELLADVLRRFSAPDGDDEHEDERDVLATIESLAAELRQAAPGQPLTLDVVRQALARAIDDGARGGVPGGAVTFCSMSSLRHLPYASVCAIGLNDGAFPSRARPAEFDLIAREPRAGDRQRRTDERNVFLDLLLAARRNFYLSYTGRSVRDNAPLPPSTLVSELLDTLLPAITGDAHAARGRLVVEHPLQGFSEQAFRLDADPRVRSFDGETAQALRERTVPPQAPSMTTPVPISAASGAAGTPYDTSLDAVLDEDEDDSDYKVEGLEPAQPFFGAPLPAPGDEWCDVPIERLIRFFANPCRFLLRQRLGIAIERADDELEDDEPFLPSVPGRSALAARLLPSLLAGASLETARGMALAGTEMPAGAIGRGELEREIGSLQRFALELRELTAPSVLPPHEAGADLTLGGRRWRLRAAFADLRPGGLVRHRYDAPRARDYLAAWLQHLMLCADAPPGVEPRTIWQARGERFVLLPCTQPLAVLRDLLALFERGLREPLPFFPKSAWAYMANGQATYRAQGAWKVAPYRPYGESGDPAYRLALRGRPDPLGAERWPEFHACAVAVFGPLLECLADAEATT